MTIATVFVALLLACFTVSAVDVDFVLHLNGLPRGVLRAETVETGAAGSFYDITYHPDYNTNLTRFYAVAPISNVTLPVSCAGVDYTGSTNWLKIVTDTNELPAGASTGQDFLEIYLAQNDVVSTIGDVHVFALVRFDLTNQFYPVGVNLDPLRIDGGGGSWSVLGQIQLDQSGYTMRMVTHAAGFGTGEASEMYSSKLYLWEAVRSYTNAVGHFRLRDASNGFSIAGEGTINIQDTKPFGLTALLHLAAGYLGNPLGGIYYKNLAARFNTTNFLSDAEILSTSPRVLNVNRANVGRIQKP